MHEFVLGREENFVKFPASIEIDQQSYYLLKNDNNYLLASRICPHMGYPIEVEAVNGELVCFLHGWVFHEQTGVCQHLPHEGLSTQCVFLRDGKLVVVM